MSRNTTNVKITPKVWLVCLLFATFLTQTGLTLGAYPTYSWVRPQNCTCTGGAAVPGLHNESMNYTNGNFSYLWTNYFNTSNNAFINNLVSTNIRSTSLESITENITLGNATYYTISGLNVTIISFKDKIHIISDSNNDLIVYDLALGTNPIVYDSSRYQTGFTDSDAMLRTDGGVISVQGTYRTPISIISQGAGNVLPVLQIQGGGNGATQNLTLINNSKYNMSQNCIWIKTLINWTSSTQRNVNAYIQACYPTGTGWGGKPSTGELPYTSDKKG